MPTLPDYLAFKRECMAEFRETLSAATDPAMPLVATARVAGGSGVRPVQVRQFTIVTDSGPALAGYGLGPTAPELLLSALASCLAHSFLLVAVNHNVTYDALEVEVRGTIDFRGVLEVGQDAPVTPQNVHYEARITSSSSSEQLIAIQRDVERLCPVLQALREPTEITGSVRREGQ